MFKKIVVLLSVFAMPSAFAIDKAEPALAATMQWSMSLDATGRITALEAKGKETDALRDKLEPVVRRWEFLPGTVNGKPARTDTLLTVQVVLTPIAGSDQLSVRVEDVRTGGTIAAGGKPPRFPRNEVKNLLRESGFARFFLEVSYDSAGVVKDVMLAEGSTQTKGKLKNSAEEAARSWTYVPERVAGIGVPGTIVVPVCFSVGSSPRAERRAADNCQWSEPGSKAIVKQGQSLALDSSVTLKSDVIGSTL